MPDVIDRYDSAQRLIRSSPPKVDELREKLLPVWLTLFGIYGKDNGASNPYLVLSELLRELIQLRRMGRKDEIVYIERAVSSALPPGYRLSNIEELKPEDRVNLFDLIIKAIDGGNSDQRSVSILCFLAGYIVTIAAGGTPSLGLAEKVSGKWPQILAWAFLIGSLGERVLWNSGFDGLGRLVTKELLKSFRLTDYPSCDIFLDEGEVLVDKKLSDPLIHLKIKQQRIISVGILPGVALTVPIDEQVATPQRPPVAYEKVVAGGQRALFGRDINDIVDLLWPRFRDKIRAEFSPESEVTGRGRSKKKEPSQERLPFKK
ncbi:hypothetical protein NKJ81_04920 [Mesorhizobium sp. M0018]|uniref:hypothetical protein n=1 Tax=Mesorhizobium sp. M0018 TaxID=2956844 RepID=UPI00333A4C88